VFIEEDGEAMTDEELRAEFKALHGKIDGLSARVDALPSTEFIQKQQARVLDRLGGIEDQITVQAGMAVRHDNYATEIGALVQLTNRANLRISKLEESLAALEGR
jgi:hypothetical protein